MDSLTQIVLGAAVGEAVLGKKIGNKALLWGAIAGTIPDLDVISNFVVSNKMQATLMHRAFTHSFLFAFLMAPIFGYAVQKLFKNTNTTFRNWTTLFFWGFLTHILLDVQTSYGTQLLWPFHNRLAISNIFVVDPLYTLPFLIFVITVLFYKRSNPKRAKINRIGIYVSSAYLILTLLIKGYTYKKFTNSLAYQKINYNRIETGPTPFNAVLWYANVETDDAFYIGAYSLFDKSDFIRYKKFDKNPILRNSLKEYQTFNEMNRFSKDWYVLTQKDSTTYYNNIRFGLMGFEPDNRDFFFSQKINIKNNDVLFESERKKFKNNKKPSSFIKKMVKKIFIRAKGIKQ
ncbi:MAG: metal-dependent hydrolase [Flavobacteriaceae bacterium]